jgi:carboxymethylenebutenolidase
MKKTLIAVGCAALVALGGCRKPGYLDDHSAHMSSADLSPRALSTSQAQDVGNLNYPASNARAAARLAASPRHGEWATFAWEPGSKDSIMAWVVYPETSNPKTPVVVVVHEIFGLSTWVRGVADQVAADGFIAVAPDLNSKTRGGPSTVTLPDSTATRLIRGVTIDDRIKGVIAAAKYGMSLPSAAQKYAVIGYCWGGQTVWLHAVHGGIPGYAGGVPFYGSFLHVTTGSPALPIVDSLAKMKMPLMLLNGATDARITAQIPFIDSTMKALKRDYSYQNYPGASHGFLRQQDDPHFVRDSTAPDGRRRNTDQEAADVAATKDGWPRTIAFLKKSLGVK